MIRIDYGCTREISGTIGEVKGCRCNVNLTRQSVRRDLNTLRDAGYRAPCACRAARDSRVQPQDATATAGSCLAFLW